MFKNLRIGIKLGLGFGLVLLFACRRCRRGCLADGFDKPGDGDHRHQGLG